MKRNQMVVACEVARSAFKQDIKEVSLQPITGSTARSKCCDPCTCLVRTTRVEAFP